MNEREDYLRYASEGEAAEAWKPYDPCPCGCGVIGWKLRKDGHVVGCKCRSHIGSRNNRKGKAAQAKGHRALGGVGFTPSNEESTGGYDVRVQVEHKAGDQIPASWRKFVSLDWTRRALSQADRARRIGDGAMPALMIEGRWLIVDTGRGMEGVGVNELRTGTPVSPEDRGRRMDDGG